MKPLYTKRAKINQILPFWALPRDSQPPDLCDFYPLELQVLITSSVSHCRANDTAVFSSDQFSVTVAIQSPETKQFIFFM